uniref:Coiled-coil domain containing 14 n=1 Tax=Sphenodon punctatus TaxID=8508 RepID=A0A8D0HCQ6_SPHPU
MPILHFSIGLRQVLHSDAESGYSLYSTDSEDQVVTIHSGLDRCAALLKDILQNEAEGAEPVNQKPRKATGAKGSSRPLLAKGGNSKRKGPKKNILSAHVRKEIVPVTNRKLVSCHAPAVDKERVLPSAEHHQLLQQVHVPSSQPSPVMHQKLCEHVQTQMALINGQASPSGSGIPAVPPYPLSDNGYQTAPAFNGRLPTSTPDLSPPHPANPVVIRSGVPVENCSQYVLQTEPVLLPAVSNGTSSTARVQPLPAGPVVMPYVGQAVANNPTMSPFFPPHVDRKMMPIQRNHEQRLKEADLIRCIQAHLALLQPPEAECGKTEQKCQSAELVPAETAEEYSESAASEEEDFDEVDVAPVRDTSCQTSFDKKVQNPKKPSPGKTSQKVKTVKYLLGELRALVADQDDSEILRLTGEVEDCISRLPAVAGRTNIQAEIALAIQPLRSENAQLRRRLRILNQQIREREIAERDPSQNCNFELISLQSLNTTLQSQLNESLKDVESMQNKNEELLKIIESQKEENKKLAGIIHERDQELLEKKHQVDTEMRNIKIEMDEASTMMKRLQFKLEASEKENQILGITLRQRDTEVNRLREMTRALQGSMAKLLSDLTLDPAKHRPVKGLTKSLLEVYEKQQQSAPYPVSTSVTSYLEKLEHDQVLTNAEPFPKRNREIEVSDLVYERFVTEGSPKKDSILAKEIAAPRNPLTFPKYDDETTDSGTVVEEPHKLDETIYLPLMSSASKKQSGISKRGMSTQHSTSLASKKLDYRCGNSTRQQNGLGITGESDTTNTFGKFSGGSGLQKTVEHTAESMGKTAKPEGGRLQMQPKETISGVAKDIPDGRPPDKYLYTLPLPCQKENLQKKNTAVSAADSSFLTLDCWSRKSEWSASSFSTFTSRDEEDFKKGLAALDANIARLQRTLQTGLMKP